MVVESCIGVIKFVAPGLSTFELFLTLAGFVFMTGVFVVAVRGSIHLASIYITSFGKQIEQVDWRIIKGLGLGLGSTYFLYLFHNLYKLNNIHFNFPFLTFSKPNFCPYYLLASYFFIPQ